MGVWALYLGYRYRGRLWVLGRVVSTEVAMDTSYFCAKVHRKQLFTWYLDKANGKYDYGVNSENK